MTTKTEFKNYLVSIKDSKTGEIILETFVHAFHRLKEEFMLQELYEKYSLEYQKEPYVDTIEIKRTSIMQVDLQKLICNFDSRLSIINLHLHPAKDGIYLCYPPRISSWADAREIIRKWFVATYFQVKTCIDPNYLEMFGVFLLNTEDIEIKHSISLMDKYVEWICRDFKIEVIVEELSFEKAKSYVSKEVVLLMEIDAVGLSKRMVNRLHSADIYTVCDLCQWNEEKLLKIRNFGINLLNEIKAFLYLHGLKLN